VWKRSDLGHIPCGFLVLEPEKATKTAVIHRSDVKKGLISGHLVQNLRQPAHDREATTHVIMLSEEIALELCHLRKAQGKAFLPGSSWPHLPAVLR
jgi:hypothetical protein